MSRCIRCGIIVGNKGNIIFHRIRISTNHLLIVISARVMLFPMRIASLFYNITHHCAVVRLKEGGGGRRKGLNKTMRGNRIIEYAPCVLSVLVT